MVSAQTSNTLLRVEKAVVRTAKTIVSLGILKDTLFTDVSEYQRTWYTDEYPHKFASFRANDGTYRDGKFAQNIAWSKKAADAGRIEGFIVYIVYRTNWQQTIATLQSMVGKPHWAMAVMIDMESWGGQVRGNQSSSANAMREVLISWLGGHRGRVLGYGNAGDLNSLWPSRGDMKVILANYSSNPAFPGKIAHQYTSSANVKPFGAPVDMNSADGYSPVKFAAALGIVRPAKPQPAHAAPPVTSAIEILEPNMDYIVHVDGDSIPATEKTANHGIWALESGHLHWVADTLSVKALLGARDGNGNKCYTEVTVSWPEICRRLMEQAGPDGKVYMPKGCTLVPSSDAVWVGVPPF